MPLKQYYKQYWMREIPLPLDDLTTEDRSEIAPQHAPTLRHSLRTQLRSCRVVRRDAAIPLWIL
jgi:hypothetical protein